MQHWSKNAGLYDDTAHDDHAAATARVDSASAALADAVRVARSLTHALARVHRDLGHLGHRE